jgi:peptidoglycan/xylan/chitin deacetylase (PgdA/CDA1 family)
VSAGRPAAGTGALCLTFDNLGEAAELELGGAPAESPHPTVTRALPAILDALDARGLAATFFVEGLNAELYPDALREIDSRGHEVAYHAWRHEQWGRLPAASQADNLARGRAAFEGLGLKIAGMRPPGGELGEEGLEVLREAGLRYCSPLGGALRAQAGLAILPFSWEHVDAACVMPDLGPPREPGELLDQLEAEIGELRGRGGFLAIVLHPFMLDWLAAERFEALLDAIGAAREDGALVGRCDALAERLLSGAPEGEPR